ncbi:MAG: glycosyltransferase [Oscillochloridaceae bacterium]|nr:glycosyltransferase [Chloroflexaceae bacterium]MDW8389816.1 glycosyltransferase [Oscillochloridaceae bacterium]
MRSLPSISVIIGVYNGAEMIGKCLESLLEQNYPRHLYDVIVVENGSHDNTIDVVRRYPVRLYQNPVRGLAAARNYGLERSDAEIIATTDADCVAHPAWLQELVKPYADPAVGGVGGYIGAYVHSERTIVEMFLDEYAPLVNFISGEHEFLPHLYGANASYRRELLLQIGGYNERLITAEDVDVSWRIQLQTGARLVYAEQAIIYHHHRTTEQGLARLYQHYGFGEILLDTLYRKYTGYPRDLRFQCQRIMGQMAALPRYMLSMLVRQWRLMRGAISPYEAEVPRLWLVIEWSNILGKLRALRATRLMRTAEPILAMDRGALIRELYGTIRE